MAVRQLRLWDDTVLRKRCKPVAVVDDLVRQLLDDMMDSLRLTETGVALAANQVGIFLRLVVIDYNGHCLKLVNPRVIEKSGVQECIEGCLSFPDLLGRTLRPQRVAVEALNEKGEEIILTGEGEMAKCLCHEIDHLDGGLFIDRVLEFIPPLPYPFRNSGE